MIYTKPDYYDDFTCIADKCPKTCCSGWQIMIDDDSLSRYKSEGLEGIDYNEACFINDENKNCCKLNSDGLCQLILDKGEDALCQTCHSFPRHIEEFENRREYSLSISCPVVADMLLRRREQVQFLVEEDLEFDQEEYDEYEQAIAEYLYDIRDYLKQILWDGQKPLVLRCIEIMHLVASFQERMDEIALSDADIDDFNVAEFIAESMTQPQRYIRHTMSYPSYRAAAYDMFEDMRHWEYTSDEFPDMLERAHHILFDIPEEEFDQLCSDVTDYMYDDAHEMSEIMNLQVIQYFLDTYFVGSCYDEYYYGQAQLAVVAGLQITLLFMAEFVEKRDSIAIEDAVRLTYTYARELEHSIPNILQSQKWMDEHRLI